MYALAADEVARSIEPVRVAVMTLVTTPTTQAVVAQLRRETMTVELVSGEVLQAPPAAPVYVTSCHAPT